jgi:hypothetical protein
MNPKLQQAVGIFKELGWEAVTSENVLSLPVGTPEQKRTALDGLKSGGFGEFTQLSANSYGWRSHVDVDEGKLALFAVRVGVSAQRAAGILNGNGSEMMAGLIAARGTKYATDFITYACVSNRRIWEHSASVFGSVAVRLVDTLSLDIPQNVEYMKDWAVYAAAALGLKAEIPHNETNPPDLELIGRRFAEHIRAGVAAGAPATGPFGTLIPSGVSHSWLSRKQAVELVFTALDAAVRPGDRKAWINVLDELNISDDELCARAQSLIPLLSTGESAVILRLAPALIPRVSADLLPEVLMAALSATAKKARQAVLKSALERTDHAAPCNAEELGQWLSMLAGNADKPTAALAARLAERWGLCLRAQPEEAPELRGLWRDTPPVWQIPPFEIGEISSEALTELAAEFVNRAAEVHDILTERFLALANAVAAQEPQAARTALRGLRNRNSLLQDLLGCWVRGEAPNHSFDRKGGIENPLTARDYIVIQKMGELPCLLSTPSYVDLSITVPDLAARLALYQDAGLAALEADLLLALTRLDLSTETPEAVQTLKAIDLPIVLQSEEYMPISAGQAVVAYLNSPIQELSLSVNAWGAWHSRHGAKPVASPPYFPNRLDQYTSERFSIFPLWGDAGLGAIHLNNEIYHEGGLVLRQAARRATPLPPGASINLLAAQRCPAPDAAEDSAQAVVEAWERGLLRPGVADIGFLDWSTKPPTRLVSLSSALDSIAQDGLLSVVWPVLDALIEASLNAPRLLAGTAELAELAASFLPEVQLAVREGKADASVLELPCIRELARRDGSSRAVTQAQQITALLPPARTPAKKKPAVPEMSQPFESMWLTRKNASPPIEDGVKMTVEQTDTAAAHRALLFTLTLPDVSDRVFQIVKTSWHYDLEHEGQCEAYAVPVGTTGFTWDKEKQVWLHWDEKKKRMVACGHRNWADSGGARLKGVKAPPLPESLLTVIVGLLAQDSEAVYFAPRLLERFLENGQIGEALLRRAARTLLQYPAVSPAKLVRVLDKKSSLLSALWIMLTESVRAAGAAVSAGEAPPVWINRVLDIALRYAPYLAEATRRGLIPTEDAKWTGLAEIAAAKSKSTAVTKAKNLITALGLGLSTANSK